MRPQDRIGELQPLIRAEESPDVRERLVFERDRLLYKIAAFGYSLEDGN